jgi:hypothetical protein
MDNSAISSLAKKLRAEGHSAAKAHEISLDFYRKDAWAVRWVNFLLKEKSPCAA